jgi:hypothetical protein
MTIGTFSRTEQCLSTAVKFPQQTWEAYRNYANSLRSMMQAMGPMAGAFKSMRDELSKMKGYPLASTSTTSIMGRTSTSSSEVTSIKEGPIPASAWEIPAGYKKVDSPMVKAMQNRKG